MDEELNKLWEMSCQEETKETQRILEAKWSEKPSDASLRKLKTIPAFYQESSYSSSLNYWFKILTPIAVICLVLVLIPKPHDNGQGSLFVNGNMDSDIYDELQIFDNDLLITEEVL